MILVIDANCFIAGFLRNAISRQIMLSDEVMLFSPSWLVDELNKNEPELIAKFPNNSSFEKTKEVLLSSIKLVPASEYSPFLKEASKRVKDSKDIPYFALALYLNCALWSNERLFKNQSRVKIWSTSDLVKEFAL